MLDSARIITQLASTNLQATHDFYAGKLGLKLVDGTPGEGPLTFQAGNGTNLFIYPREEVQPASNTAAGFLIQGIEDAVARLQKAGVVFEEYPEMEMEGPIARTPDGGAAAWFRDPDGHTLGLFEM